MKIMEDQNMQTMTTSAFMSADISELAAALAEAQAELSPAAKNAQNPHLKNRYADIAAVYEAIRETLPKHGLSVSQIILPHESKARVRTLLMHKSGQWLASECLMPLDRNGGPQGMGSAITYARRYSLSAIVGVVSEDDDDAEAAQPRRQQQRQAAQQRETAKANNPDPMTKTQSAAIMAHLTKTFGNDREMYLKELSGFFGRRINSSRELTRDMASRYIDAINNPQG